MVPDLDQDMAVVVEALGTFGGRHMMAGFEATGMLRIGRPAAWPTIQRSDQRRFSGR